MISNNLKIVWRSSLDPFHRDTKSGLTWREFTRRNGWTAQDHEQAERIAKWHADLLAKNAESATPNPWDNTRPWARNTL